MGRIAGCFGIRGYLKLELAGGSQERALALRKVLIGTDPARLEAREVADVRIEGGRVLVRFEGLADRTSAEVLRGKRVFVDEADAAPPPPGGHYVHDVIGCEVRTRDGRIVGRIADVLDAAGRHIWTIRSGDAEYLLPAVREFVVSVDTANGIIIVDPPEGLLG